MEDVRGQYRGHAHGMVAQRLIIIIIISSSSSSTHAQGMVAQWFQLPDIGAQRAKGSSSMKDVRKRAVCRV